MSGQPEQADEFAEGQDLGPDERDRDLLDGSWEQEYYSGRIRTRDWNAIMVGVAILLIAGLVLPALLVVLR